MSVENDNSSSFEEPIAYFKNIENVTIVEEYTNGSFSCGNCIDFYLPNSHLKVYFGTGLVLYNGNINIDAGCGFKGDISFEEFVKLEFVEVFYG